MQRSSGLWDLLGHGLWSVAEQGPLRNCNEIAAKENLCHWEGLLESRKNSDVTQDRNNLLFYPGKITKTLWIVEVLNYHLEFSQKEGEKRAKNSQSTSATLITKWSLSSMSVCLSKSYLISPCKYLAYVWIPRRAELSVGACPCMTVVNRNSCWETEHKHCLTYESGVNSCRMTYWKIFQIANSVSSWWHLCSFLMLNTSHQTENRSKQGSSLVFFPIKSQATCVQMTCSLFCLQRA